VSGDLPDGVHGKLLIPAKSYARNRSPWLVTRRTGIGASDMAAILGMNPWRSAVDVWFDKMSTEKVTDSMPSEAAEWGLALEDSVARRVVKRHPELGKLVPSPGLLAHEDHPWMLATVDRLLAKRLVRPLHVDSALEIKTVSPASFEESWHPEHPEHDRPDWPPWSVQVQVQQQLAVTGLPFAWVAVLVGGQRMPAPYRIERDRPSSTS
jgi:putative phage-type endonuclease